MVSFSSTEAFSVDCCVSFSCAEAFSVDCCEQMPFVTKQPAYNILYDLIMRTIMAVKELDSLQAERFQRKIRFALQEPNGVASDSTATSATTEEVSTGDESAVCMRIMVNVGHLV